jgi:hypothetical protein
MSPEARRNLETERLFMIIERATPDKAVAAL